MLITCNIFRIYGLEGALLGRLTEPSDCDSARPVIVLSESIYLPPALAAWLVERPLEYPLNPDWRVFCYLAAITVIAGVGAGLAPAFESLNVNLVESLKGTKKVFGTAATGTRIRNPLVGTQVAVGLVLLLCDEAPTHPQYSSTKKQ